MFNLIWFVISLITISQQVYHIKCVENSIISAFRADFNEASKFDPITYNLSISRYFDTDYEPKSIRHIAYDHPHGVQGRLIKSLDTYDYFNLSISQVNHRELDLVFFTDAYVVDFVTEVDQQKYIHRPGQQVIKSYIPFQVKGIVYLAIKFKTKFVVDFGRDGFFFVDFQVDTSKYDVESKVSRQPPLVGRLFPPDLMKQILSQRFKSTSVEKLKELAASSQWTRTRTVLTDVFK